MRGDPRRVQRRPARDLPPIPQAVFQEPRYCDGEPYETTASVPADRDDSDDDR